MTNTPELVAAVKAWRANDREAVPMMASLSDRERREALRQIRLDGKRGWFNLRRRYQI